MKRRRLLKGLLGLGAASGVGYWWLSRSWDGYLDNPCLQGLPETLRQSKLWQAVWQGIEPTNLWDAHVHTVGVGDSDSGVWINPKMKTWRHPLQHAQYRFYMDAACVENNGALDRGYLERILTLMEDYPNGAKLMLLAFDYQHDNQGKALQAASTFYVPNDYVARLASDYPEKFEWVASIHPYRADALDELDKAVEKGAVAIKWLPPAHNINLLSKRCDRFYQKLADYQLPLICHGGEEKAVHSEELQTLGNPLSFRRPLDQGVKVVIAHCASLGQSLDLDKGSKNLVDNFTLFERLMDEEQYKNNLFGEISATLQINRPAPVLQTLLSRTDWHSRLINGSDYPLPAVMPLISLKKLVNYGVLESHWLEPLNQLRQYNGLMFDFAIKRLLKYEGKRFSSQIFETRNFFQR